MESENIIRLKIRQSIESPIMEYMRVKKRGRKRIFNFKQQFLTHVTKWKKKNQLNFRSYLTFPINCTFARTSVAI